MRRNRHASNTLAALADEKVCEILGDGDGRDRAVDEPRVFGPVKLHSLGMVLHAVDGVPARLHRGEEPVHNGRYWHLENGFSQPIHRQHEELLLC